ncbi:DUF5935 domain-containing protein [Pacificimonas flava]|uniref:O-glycosylation ligase, exosortase A system-associated n=1 Tax=Pacificimonas flava TaxID=1234595 RepID=M2TJZ2_9SPHN|nr:DUF5935 domain-containing protein [Pacificimonas flava]EMD81986.1 hypothetical protein C725_2642 [Pacificimonas flava]MBB5280451.1 putative O-glycosylation ligase (exosortase A-associated) [Pacificimonas flava]
MRDIFLVLILLAFVISSFRVPYFMALGYLWVDFLQPQRMGYYLFNQLPVAMILGAGAFLAYILFDRERRLRLDTLQVLVLLLVGWATLATFGWGEVDGSAKWDWVSKALLFSVFLPFVLTNRVRIEAALAVMIFSMSAITISGGLKTLMGGGGYGTLSLLVSNNTGLYEGSILSTVGCATIPLVWWLYKNNSFVPPSKITFLLASGLSLSFILITFGSEARTGLLALGVLLVILWWQSKRKILYATAISIAFLLALPFVPKSFTDRMDTIGSFQADQSASTRIAVWNWTLDYLKDNPLGGGFDLYKINSVEVTLVETSGSEDSTNTTYRTVTDKARAFHSSYFEVLGETGYIGFFIWSSIMVVFYLSGMRLHKKNKDIVEEQGSDRVSDAEWCSSFGRAIMIYVPVLMTGSLFVGIAFQPALFNIVALTVAVKNYQFSKLEPYQRGAKATRSRNASLRGRRVSA